MLFNDIVAGNYGWAAVVAFEEEDDDGDLIAQDISAYTTLEILFTSPAGITTTYTATLNTDGSDGQIRYTTEDGDIDAAGDWKVYGRVTKADAKITSVPETFYVHDSPD